jgi:hypothetical protein
MGATFGLWCGEVTLDVRPSTSRGVPASVLASGESPHLRGIEKLCAGLVSEAIHAYVQGEREAAWWLFEEEEGGTLRSGLPLADVCQVLDIDVGQLRARLKGLLKVTGLEKAQARDYVQQQIWGRRSERC